MPGIPVPQHVVLTVLLRRNDSATRSNTRRPFKWPGALRASSSVVMLVGASSLLLLSPFSICSCLQGHLALSRPGFAIQSAKRIRPSDDPSVPATEYRTSTPSRRGERTSSGYSPIKEALVGGHQRCTRIGLHMTKKRSYKLGLGKNKPFAGDPGTNVNSTNATLNLTVPFEVDETNSAVRNWNFDFDLPVTRPPSSMKESKAAVQGTVRTRKYSIGLGKNRPLSEKVARAAQQASARKKRLIAKDEDSEFLARAVGHYHNDASRKHVSKDSNVKSAPRLGADSTETEFAAEETTGKDASLPLSGKYLVGDEQVSMAGIAEKQRISHGEGANVGKDHVWETLRSEAKKEAEREPLLVSFLFSTILNHDSLESALAFHLANRLSSPAMISTQVMSLCLEALQASADFRKSVREDMLAVRERDPACTNLPSVFLYFKGFHALQTYRVAHYLWQSGRQVLAQYLQSQMSQVFQIDIHPNATLGSGLMLDHGTGIVIGETAVVGYNCSILHHVTLGGSGKKGVDRHPKIGDSVLIGAGASILGNIRVGNGCQIGAGTLVIADLPDHTVAVGVPAKIIGSFVDETAGPSQDMNQVGTKEFEGSIARFSAEGI